MNIKPYPIYVISLKRAPERKLYIQRQLDALNLNYQVVDAIDKRDLRSPQYRAEVADLLGIDKTLVEIRGTSYSFRSHLACALSHVKAYNLMRSVMTLLLVYWKTMVKYHLILEGY